MDIILKNVTKKYGSTAVLENFSAVFPEKAASCIMGPSGCGKTTLMRLLMGLESADEGEISGVPPARSAVFQEDRLCEDFSATANVMLCADRKYSRSDAENALARLGLGDSLDKPAKELSGGMRRRVAIVRAVMAPCDVVFLDEAFKGLDEEMRLTAIAYVREMTAGKTVLSVTHSADEAELLGGKNVLCFEKQE